MQYFSQDGNNQRNPLKNALCGSPVWAGSFIPSAIAELVLAPETARLRHTGIAKVEVFSALQIFLPLLLCNEMVFVILCEQSLVFVYLCAVCSSDCIRNSTDLTEKFVPCQSNFCMPFPPTGLMYYRVT